MAMKFSLSKITEYRKSIGFNQKEFWSRIGVTQSGGSRYEAGRSIPVPTVMLLWLVEQGKVSDKELEQARRAAARRC